MYNKWFIEYFSDTEAHLYSIKQYLISKITQYQTMEIVNTYAYGKCLFLDGKIQSAEIDEFIYHEALVQPAIVLHSLPQNIAVVGGGEGATLREILRCKNVKKVKMIDIDKEVVNYCKEFLAEWHQGAFEDERTELIFTDARKYLEEKEEIFDVIIIDITEPIPNCPSYLLYTKEFYETVFKRLHKDGIIALQAGNVGVHNDQLFVSIIKTLKSCFPIVYGYQAYIPSFQKSWGFVFASSQINPLSISKDEIDKRIKERIGNSLRFYDGETHHSIFHLPKYLREDIVNAKEIICDKSPKYTEL